MKRLVAPVILTGALLAVVQAGAGTNLATRTTVNDPHGDSKPGHADIESVTAVLSPSAVTWTIVAYNVFTTAKAPCVRIKSVQPAGAIWSVCRGDPAKVAPPCIISVSLGGPWPRGGGCDGPAGVTRPNGSTIVYRVPRKTFTGLKPSPRAISWQARVQDLSGCYPQACDETAFSTSRL